MIGDNPLVSVLLPYYNGKKYVREAIDSILNQTYKNIEIVIVDDASPDKESKDYITSLTKELGIKLIYHSTNQGGAKGNITAFKNSSGELIAFTAQDDLYLPEKIERQVQAMKADDLDAVYSPGGSYCQWNGKTELPDVKKVIEWSSDEDFKDNCTMSNVYGASAQGLLVKRYVVEESLINIWQNFMLDDWPVNITLFTKYKTKFMNDCLVLHRKHDNNTSWNLWKWFAPKLEVPARLASPRLKAEGVGRQITSSARRFLKQGDMDTAAVLSLTAAMIVESKQELGRVESVLKKIPRSVKKKPAAECLSAIDNPGVFSSGTVCGWDEFAKKINEVVKNNGGFEKMGEVFMQLAGSLDGTDKYKFILAAAVLSKRFEAVVPDDFLKDKVRFLRSQSRFSLRGFFK